MVGKKEVPDMTNNPPTENWKIMNVAVLFIWAAVIVVALKVGGTDSVQNEYKNIRASVYFSPNGGCTDAIVNEINDAKQFVMVGAYRLTSIPIAQALVAAKERGVAVSIILDKAQQSTKYSDATYFHNHQIDVLIDHQHQIMHNKVIIIDGKTVITGSMNFSASGETRNAENVLILTSNKLVDEYVANFNLHKNHSLAYKSP
jgi:phosphatidylserine/phosphatidylglycerophosphate/cardiolipin synthase-like enzyme